MSGIKAQQKTLIRKLMKEARTDFPKLAIPEFPVISKQIKQVAHLINTQWERLVAKIVDLSGGTARQQLTNGQYASLQWSSRNRLSTRNWVDLYDVLHLQLSSDIRFWPSGDTKTGPPDGLLMGLFRGPLDLCFIGRRRVGVVGAASSAA